MMSSSGHRDWFRDEHVIQVWPITANLGALWKQPGKRKGVSLSWHWPPKMRFRENVISERGSDLLEAPGTRGGTGI